MNRSAEIRKTEAGWQVECKFKGEVIKDFVQPFVIILNQDFSLLIVERIALEWIDYSSIATNPVWYGEGLEDCLQSLHALRDVLSASRAIGTERVQ